MKARILIPLLVLVFAALAAPAFAVDPTCIPPATGVFGDATPPHWWDGTGQAAYYNSPDDPRWVGSGAITLADGASTEADFRGLYSGTDLYLSWRVFVAPTGVAIQNHLYLGFVQSGGTPMVIDVTPPDTLSGNDITPTIVVHELQSNGQLGASIATPPWLTDARVWINQPLLNFWAFEMRVPTSAITIPGNTFSMWFELLAGTPDTHDHAYTWPDNTTGEIIGADPNVFGDVDHYPWTDQWQPFHLSTGPGDTSCAGGVSLDVYQIGVRHPGAPATTPGSQVLYKVGGPAPINTMVARPRNDTGGQINTGDLRATFALADWGSVIGVGANWTPIPLVGCSDCADGKIGNSGAIPNATLADTTNEIHFDWQLGPADYTPYENGMRARDNCMLVTLTSRTGGVKFVNNSIRRNMDFVSASTMTRTAQISIKGLAPIAPDGRDVYLYIETLNMPAKVSQEQPVPGKLQTTSFVQPNGNQPTPAELQTTSFVQPNGNQPTPVELDEMAASGKLTDAQMDQFLPTYRIHVSHDTGNTITVAGTKRPLLRSQGGFGYRVVHQGTLLGWVHKTICLDCTMTEIAPNFYKISKVPNNGVVHVRTTIQAIEPGSSSAQYRFFIDLGPNFPQGNFSHGVDGKFSVNAGIERLLPSNNSIEGILGYHRFDTAFVSNPHIWQLSANMKHYFGPGPLHGFLNGGIGAYRFDPGNTTKAGANVGGGLLWDVSPTWGLEAVYNFYRISTSGSSTDFSTFQVGARFRL